MTQDDMKRKIIDIVESTKLAGFDANTLHYDGKDGGFSNQKEGYYDTVSAVKELEALVNLAVIEARIDERESMKFINADGIETHAPYLAYRYTGDGLLVDWDTRTKDLEAQKQALTGEGE